MTTRLTQSIIALKEHSDYIKQPRKANVVRSRFTKESEYFAAMATAAGDYESAMVEHAKHVAAAKEKGKALENEFKKALFEEYSTAPDNINEFVYNRAKKVSISYSDIVDSFEELIDFAEEIIFLSE